MEEMNKCCTGCGAKTRSDHDRKVTLRGVYRHAYNGPGKHAQSKGLR